MSGNRSMAATAFTAAQAALLGLVWRALLVVAGLAILVGALADAVEARAAQPQPAAWVRYRSLAPPSGLGRSAALCVNADFSPCAAPSAAGHAVEVRPSPARPAQLPACASRAARGTACAASWPWRFWTVAPRRAL